MFEGNPHNFENTNPVDSGEHTPETYGAMEGEDSLTKALSSLADDVGMSDLDIEELLQIWNPTAEEKELLIQGSNPLALLSMLPGQQTVLTQLQEKGRAFIRGMDNEK